MTLLDLDVTEASHDLVSNRTDTPRVAQRHHRSTLDNAEMHQFGTVLDRLSPTLTDVSAVVDGTSARLRYTTTAAFVEILVSPFRPVQIDGCWTELVLDAVDGTDLSSGGYRATYDLTGLRPERTYHFIITVPTESGSHAHQVVGTFETTRALLAA